MGGVHPLCTLVTALLNSLANAQEEKAVDVNVQDLSEKLNAADTCIQITFKISVIDNILLKGLPF